MSIFSNNTFSPFLKPQSKRDHYKPLLKSEYQNVILNNLAEKHGRFDFYYSKIIDKIVKDAPNQRIVAIFKDYLIYDDASCECLRKVYPIQESQEKLSKLSEFYNDYADIFPSYALLLQPCQDEITMIIKDKEGMAKYMYKNIRRKQRIIDEKYSIVERNKRKDANQAIEQKHHYKINNKIQGKRPTKNQNNMFFTPSFLHSVIKFEKNLAKRERITYLRKIAFDITLGNLLDQFIEKDSQQIVPQEAFYCGRVIEPLHLIDNIYHIELEKDLQKREQSKKRASLSRSKSPITKINKQIPKKENLIQAQPPRIENLLRRLQQPQILPNFQRKSISPATQRNKPTNVPFTANQLSKLRTPRELDKFKKETPRKSPNVYKPKSQTKSPNNQSKSPHKSVSPSVVKAAFGSSPVQYSLQKRSPMKNIENVTTTPSKLLQTHQILRTKISPIRELGKPPHIISKLQTNSPIRSPNSMYNKTTSMMLGQSIKMLLKANKQKTNSNLTQHTSNQETSGFKSTIHSNTGITQYETPNKNAIRSREISGSKGRMQVTESNNKSKELTITNINLRLLQTSKFQIPEDEEISQVLDFSKTLEQKTQAASKIRESIIKRPVLQQERSNPFYSVRLQEYPDEVLNLKHKQNQPKVNK